MKFAGVVNEYKEAAEIEDIVKVFVIQKRINDLLSLDRGKNPRKYISSDIDFPIQEEKYLNNSDEKILHSKFSSDFQHFFCVRGLV